MVTKEEILTVLRKYFLPLFNSSSSIALVVTTPSRAEQICQDLTSLNFEVSSQVLDTEEIEGEETESEQ